MLSKYDNCTRLLKIGYELAIIISYPTSASGIIVVLKTLTKYREFFRTLFVKTTDFQLVFKDQFKFLGKNPPTPPPSQHFILSEK